MFVDRPPPGGVAAYIQAAQPVHERLQAILTQTAGYSLLVMTRGGRIAFLDEPVVTARRALEQVQGDLDAMRLPGAARHHHSHLVAATTAIGHALDSLTACLRLSATDLDRAELSRALQAATDHLRTTTRLLPGFEMVDLSQACCAAHGSAGSTLICQTVEG